MKKDKTTEARRGSAKKATGRRTVRQRAQAIINNSAAYSDDTREAIKNALDFKDDNLAEIVGRAEHGDEILDCTVEAAVRSRAEAIIDSPKQSNANRAIVKVALEKNFSNLADIVTHAERGEVLAAIQSSPAAAEEASATTAGAGDTGRDDRQTAWNTRHKQPHTFTFADSSRMYEEGNYADLLDNRPRLNKLVDEVMHGDDHDQTLALLTLLHAAASFENVDARRRLCILVARVCMDDITDVWGALGAALIRRAATDKPENE